MSQSVLSQLANIGGYGSGVQQRPIMPRPGKIRWGGQYFDNPSQIVAWANARGANLTLADFLARHPGLGGASATPQPQRPRRSALAGLLGAQPY